MTPEEMRHKGLSPKSRCFQKTEERDKDKETLKIVPREGQNPACRQSKVADRWTKLLIQMSELQLRAHAAGVGSALKHFIALQKELEYHTGFRYIRIDPKTYKEDPRRG